MVIDAGAHIGTFTLYIKSLNPAAKIYAIEPVNDNLRLLNKNIKLNSFSKITCLNSALSDKNGKSKIWVYEHSFDSASLIESRKRPTKNSHIIPTLTLRKILRIHHIDLVDVLKMDIEGEEYKVIKEDLDVLAAKVKRIMVEYHESRVEGSREKIIKLLTSKKFKLDFEHRHILGFINQNTLKLCKVGPGKHEK